MVRCFLRRIIVIHRPDRNDPLTVIAPRHRIKIGDERVAQLHRLADNAQCFCVIAPRTPFVVRIIGTVQAQNRTEHPELHPARIQLCFFYSLHMPADVVAPPAKADVSGGSGEVWLKGQRRPVHVAVPGETHRITVVTQTTPAREDEASPFLCTRPVVKMEVVQPPERVETRQAALLALLPVNPPEIDPLLFQRVMQIPEIGQSVAGIGDGERNRRSAVRRYLCCLCHLGVSRFVGVDALRRMQVQGYFQPLPVEPRQKLFRFREKRAVPRVAGPSRRAVARLGHMPIHIHDTDRQGHFVPPEGAHQGRELFLRIRPVAAPPVAERPAWKQGHRSGYLLVGL